MGCALAVLLSLLLPVGTAAALSLADLPPAPPASHVIDGADVLSRAGRAEIEKQLESLGSDRVDGRLITLNHLDYGLDLSALATQLLERWAPPPPSHEGQPLLLLLIDTQNKATAIVTSPELERQLPASLLRSTARTTMAQPLREGDRYRQASLDAIKRLNTVLQGGEDPGEPLEPEVTVPATNIPTAAETREGNGLTWIVVLLVVGSVVPMATWWIFSR
ncbi:MAG: photosystem II repair protein Psb32 [Cyanobium sp.]